LIHIYEILLACRRPSGPFLFYGSRTANFASVKHITCKIKNNKGVLAEKSSGNAFVPSFVNPEGHFLCPSACSPIICGKMHAVNIYFKKSSESFRDFAAGFPLVFALSVVRALRFCNTESINFKKPTKQALFFRNAFSHFHVFDFCIVKTCLEVL
jgi:hypothetical protein